jgi:hypothetical protein
MQSSLVAFFDAQETAAPKSDAVGVMQSVVSVIHFFT